MRPPTGHTDASTDQRSGRDRTASQEETAPARARPLMGTTRAAERALGSATCRSTGARWRSGTSAAFGALTGDQGAHHMAAPGRRPSPRACWSRPFRPSWRRPVVSRLLVHLEFVGPVQAGERVRSEVRLADAARTSRGWRVLLTSSVRRANGDLVLRGEADGFLPPRITPPSGPPVPGAGDHRRQGRRHRTPRCTDTLSSAPLTVAAHSGTDMFYTGVVRGPRSIVGSGSMVATARHIAHARASWPTSCVRTNDAP
jgi:hypothetical protein